MFSIGKRDATNIRVVIAAAVDAVAEVRDGDDIIVAAQDAQPEAAVVLVPIEPKMRRRAIRAAQRMLDRMGVPAGGEIEGDLLFDVSEEVSRELLRLGIVGIEGIADEATGEPFDLTPDRETRLRTASDPDRPMGTIEDLLADERVFAKLDAEYVIPDAKRRAEKNGLSASPNGTSAAATRGSATAPLAARPKRKAAAKRARTASTRSRATKRKASGKS